MTHSVPLRVAVWALLLAVFPLPATADYVLYTIPGTRLRLALEGKVTVHPDRWLTYTNASLKASLNFPYSKRDGSVQVFKVPSVREQFLNKTRGSKAAQVFYDAAVAALKQGSLVEFHKGVEETLKLDPAFAPALRVKELKAEMDRPIPDDPAQEAALQQLVKNSNMRVVKSPHFILLTDTPDKVPPPRGPNQPRLKKRADQRLDLLEQVYESYLLLFGAQEVALDVPRQRLSVVLFDKHEDYLAFSKYISPTLTSAAGFWDPHRNVSVFYDHGSTERFKRLKALSTELTDLAKLAKQTRTQEGFEVARMANTIALLLDIVKENEDITVVSHEATHQMAGNTGLFPRYVRIPSWVHEGLATYFESPAEGGWSGIGAVNSDRLEWYRALEADPDHSNIDFIVGDQIFTFANSLGASIHGYGQAWALTHFMMEKKLPQTVRFYRRLGEMPPETFLSPDVLTGLFDAEFGTDRAALDLEWRNHMRSLKPDLERLLEESSRAGR